MIIFATTIHALSAIAFVVIGLLVLSNDGTIATNDVTITLALLGFNVMIRYLTTTGGEQADAASEDAGRDPRQMGRRLAGQRPPASGGDATDAGRRNERGQIEPGSAAPERHILSSQELAARELADASERVAQLMAEAERNRERRD